MNARKTTYGRMKIRPSGCRPTQLSFVSGPGASSRCASVIGSGVAPRTDVMTSPFGQEFVGSIGRLRESLVDRLVVEHHRRGPRVSERLPDLGGVGHVRNLHDPTRLIRE